jgi:hypothetical protein
MEGGDQEGSGPPSLSAFADEPDSGGSGVFCNACGWRNPVGARFCSRCGEKLQETAREVSDPRPSAGDGGVPGADDLRSATPARPSKRKAEPTPESTPPGGLEAGAGRRMGIIVGAAVLIVLAVFMLFNMGGSRSAATSSSGATTAPVEPPLSAEFSDREEVLQSELAGLTGDARINKQRELLTLYFTSGRLDLAGAKAEEIGRATNSETAWIDAGNFYYDWLESSPPENKAYYAQKATAAYREALEINPENLDVRTDMAVAYLYDPDNAMLAIQETQRVLEADSNHVQANFNRGIMLWQISRIDEARAQFEKVLSLVDDPEAPIYQRAAEALASLRQGSETP